MQYTPARISRKRDILARILWFALMRILNMDRLNLKYVWEQEGIPVVLRRTGKGQRLRVRLPYSDSNRLWLQNDRRTKPVWITRENYWELPKTWFNDFVNRSLLKYGKVYIIQPYREQEVCAPACQNATGHECQCSCMGLYHGTGSDKSWFVVSDTFATRWHQQQLACRLLAAKYQS